MPPNQEACKLLATSLKTSADLIKAHNDVRAAVAEAIELMISIKWGGSLVGTIASEFVSLIASVASEAASVFVGAVSNTVKTFVEGMFDKVLLILLAFPTAIFSLVSIPLDQAKKSTEAEYRFLRKAEKNMRVILSIIQKWTRTRSGHEYYEQMRDSLPLITQAIQLANDIITDLVGSPFSAPERVPDGFNSAFDESKYKQMKGLINRAIDITRPKSTIDQRLGINRRLEADKQRRYAQKRKAINTQYRIDRAGLNQSHRENLARISGEFSSTDDPGALGSIRDSGENINGATQEYVENLKYQDRLKQLDEKRKTDLADALIEAEQESLLNSQNYVASLGNNLAAFTYDIEILGRNLSDLVNNTGRAFSRNKESQLFCNNITNMDGLIRSLINEMIQALRRVGNGAAAPAAASIESARHQLEEVEDLFLRDTTLYGSPSMTSAGMAGDVFFGNTYLLSADALLNSTITESLVDLINSDDVLQDSNDEFNEFTTELSQIPDWDGKPNVWAVDIANSATSPYIQLTVDLTTALAKLPILSFSSRETDRLEMRAIITRSNNTFRSLRVHNRAVRRVLNSYTPYMASEAGDLKSILGRAGLLKEFATTMSVASVTATLVSSLATSDGNGVSYESCSRTYPDLFDDIDLAGAAATSEANMPAEQESEAFTENAEIVEDDTKTVKKAMVTSADANSGIDENIGEITE